jgi:two-component system CheB/CheR fusion protein
VVVTFIDVTTVTQAERRQGVLIAELQHRTRNLLAVVQSIAGQTLGEGGSLEAFAARLRALSRVQSLVGETMADEIDLGEIVRLELEAIGGPQNGKVTVSGPPVQLGFELVQTIGLALHELTTNAAKHGALKEETGRLEIAWHVAPGKDGVPHLTLHWRESGVTSIPETPGTGFGRELIEGALRYTLRAETDFAFGPDGISCRIEMPLQSPVP